jgi:hypothetical protein
MTAETELTESDTEALQRALQTVRAESLEDATRLDSLAEQKGWFEAAATAAYRCQVRSLRLKPWHCPPCDCGDIIFKHGGYGNTEKEVRLRLRMKALGISVYEPDPIGAIEKADEARRAARTNTPVASAKSAHVSRKNKPSAPTASA